MDRLLWQLLQDSPDAILIADRDGAIRFWNSGAERMFGHTSTEALGQSLDLIIPENLRARHWQGYFRVMNTGQTKYLTERLTSPCARKDGSRLSLGFSMVLFVTNKAGCDCTLAEGEGTQRTSRHLREATLR